MLENEISAVHKHLKPLYDSLFVTIDEALLHFVLNGCISRQTQLRVQQQSIDERPLKLLDIILSLDAGWHTLHSFLCNNGQKELSRNLQTAAGYTYEWSQSFPITFVSAHLQTHATLQQLWNVPIRQNRFVGRDSFLEQLEMFKKVRLQESEHSSRTTKVFAVCVGLGGVGKTSIALEYVYRTFDTYNYVFWVSATTREGIESCLAQLGAQLCLPVSSSSNTEMWSETCSWLQAHPGWLIVLDDAPNFSVVQTYIPRVGGLVLVTSRHTEWPCQTLNITTFAKIETMEYLKLVLRSEVNESECAAFANALENLPLAISQATAYMSKLRIGVPEYLVKFETAQRQLLHNEVLAHDYDCGPVYLTLTVSVEQTKQDCSFAVELLRFCSLLSDSYVPETLICEYAKLRNCSDVLEAAHATLFSYSLMSNTSNSGRSMSMHSLVQTLTKSDLTAAEVDNYVKDLCIAICNAWPRELDFNLNVVRDLYPALEVCLQHVQSEGDASKTHIMLLSVEVLQKILHIAESAHNILGYHLKLKNLLEKKLSAQTLNEGPDHVNTARTLYNLGNVYGDLGDYWKKKELLEKSLLIQVKNYGPDHMEVANIYNNLGHAYGALGNNQKKKELLEKVLLIQEKHCGFGHKEVATILNDLGHAYGALGHNQKKKELLERVLLIQEKHYGSDHGVIATILNDLGHAYGALGDNQKKKELLERALVIQEKHYGSDHRVIATILNDLGHAYGALGDYLKKNELLEKSLSIQRNDT